MFPQYSEVLQEIEYLKEEYKNKQVNWGVVGYIIFKRTYARFIENENRTEEWYETIARCIAGAVKLGTPYTKEEIRRLFKYMFEFKVIFAGRHLWQLGTSTVDKVGMDSLNNCWAYPLDNWRTYCKSFNELMLGGGVGFSVEKQFISQLPVVKQVNKVEKYHMVSLLPMEDQMKYKEKGILIESSDNKAINYLVADSRTGWVKALEQLLKCYFETGQNLFLDFSLIRKKGELIKGFGGKSSGAEPLIKGLFLIKDILHNAIGRKLSSVEAMDIMCILADIVVSGNVRRSALLALGDKYDFQFLTCKRWDLGNGYPSYRGRVNISVVTDDIKSLPEMFWQSYEKGESIGIFNRTSAVNFDRIGYKHYDPDSSLINPCAEATINDESCNLAETFLPNFDSIEEMEDGTCLVYKYCKTVTQGNYIYKEVQKKINKNAKIGIGITGVLQATDRIFWLDRVYKNLRKYDKQFSKNHNLPESKKLTVIKPSGTLSLLAGCTSGIHPAYAKYYYRTVQFAVNDPLLELCKKHGCKTEYKITKTKSNEDGTYECEYDYNSVIVYFPCKTDDKIPVRHDISAVKQMNYVALMQKYWVDQSVSVTVYFNDENLKEIREYLEANWDNFKTISFLKDEHGFLQAPFIEITEEEYNQSMLTFIPIASMEGFKDYIMELESSSECEGGFCPIK